MVTVPAIFLGLIFLAGWAFHWVLGVITTLRALRRMSKREAAEFVAAIDLFMEASRRDDDDDHHQDGGSLQPAYGQIGRAHV